MRAECDAVVIGGGFFGCMTALRLCGRRPRVVLLEEEGGLLLRASYNNQARIHNGYHYPRSFRTAHSSHLNFPRFVRQFESCVDQSFTKYYAVARLFSKVTARQFANYCRRVGAPVAPAPESARRLFNPDLVEDVFRVTEFAFDADRLRALLETWLAEAGVEVRCRTRAVKVEALPGGRLRLTTRTPDGDGELVAGEAFNCTYAQINRVLADSGLPLIPVKLELAEMALVRVPAPLRDVGITLMCGPFFSVMPFPARGLHSLSHVRYTPHAAWHEGGGPGPSPRQRPHGVAESRFAWMVRDAARYVPLLRECRHEDSLWEVKAVLPRNEADDGRPILLRRDHGVPNLHCVLGAKIDNIYDLMDQFGPWPTERRSA